MLTLGGRMFNTDGLRRLLGSAIAMLCVVGMAGAASAQSKIKVGYMPIAEETPKFVAVDRGIFKEHGLDVEMVRFESGPDMGTALLGGSIQVGMIGTPGLISAAVAGRPLVAIVDNGRNKMDSASGYEYYTGIVVLDQSPIRTLGDLKGKKLAVNVLKANSEAQTVMQIARWNTENPGRRVDLEKDVRLVEMPFGSMPAALEKGIVDAASMIEPFSTQLRQSRKVRVVAPVEYALAEWPVSFGVVKRDYGAKNIDILKSYRAAWTESVQWIRQNPSAAKTIMQKYTGVTPGVAQDIVLPDWSTDINATLPSTEKVVNGMMAGGMLSKKPNLNDVIVPNLDSLAKEK
jgi:NitT/TauT family transport system substrate-binding protein